MKSNVFICPPCGESVAQATKEGQNKNKALWPLLPRLTAVLPPQGREMSFGFTLIELLVVVLIIGILAAVALPQYRIAVAKSRYAKLKHMVRALVEAEEVYYLANGDYTINMEDLDVEIPNGTLDTEESTDTKHRYVYDWGYCWLYNTTEKRADCVDNEVNMGYREYYIHTVRYSGKRVCVLRDTTDETDWRTAICKAETNNGEYWKDTKYNFQRWDY